ncbi:hypothetical protein OQJ21_05145 [Legionella anisa]|uniref:Transposase IS4-like domain-containing protein n=1 Tax=Legionella anisa TaxID=28082 RepID=A0AAX0WXU2_9GAMM|nr:hypothetical protein [Legionella anisa]AWN72433.1 hypothetical protein DLD14_00400 [Legionella anisa]MCW8446714.1 hypothetical protein [Legionella anisa]PNL62883.1 hypothetical protein A6J39_017685 [Legionella anisa]
MIVTDSVRLDGNYLPGLIEQIDDPIEQITGDGAYDKQNCYEVEQSVEPNRSFLLNIMLQSNEIK